MNERYAARMRALLGEEFSAYEACLSQPPVRGIRVNTLKIGAEAFRALSPFSLERVPWEENGFYIAAQKPGQSFYHDAGLYYVQEPSAMCAAPMLGARAGERVLDLCSAPGGKGTQLAQAMRGGGVLVLNEKIPARAQVLLQNVERLGIENAVVTCADPERLAEQLGGYFDKILVDAPCSGEGMLRKEEEAAAQWSEETVQMCAARQKKILASAVKMLAPGGTLVYSTCTFSAEEDEENAAWLVRAFPQLSLIREEKLYPHRVRGEGHYAACFVSEGERAYRGRLANAGAERRALSAFRAFAADALTRTEWARLASFGDALCALPEELPVLRGVRVLRAGLKLGEVRGDRFEPSHALAMASPACPFCRCAALDAEQAARYFAGETLPASLPNGWCAVTYGGYALGLAKSAGGVLKNHLPKGLRRTGNALAE